MEVAFEVLITAILSGFGGLDENHTSNTTGRANERKSYGLKILKERLRLISKNSSFRVNNRMDREGCEGCEAIITIPLEASSI